MQHASLGTEPRTLDFAVLIPPTVTRTPRKDEQSHNHQSKQRNPHASPPRHL